MKIFGGLLLSLAAATLASTSTISKVANPEKTTLPGNEWPLLGGNAGQWQYSSLNTINDRNVSKLGLAWVVDLPVAPGLIGNPQIMDGVIYQGAPGGRIIANDLRTGKLIWFFEPEERDREHDSFTSFWASHFNRGVAVDKDHAYIGGGDCRLFAVDRRSGKQVWQIDACDSTKDYGIVGAPRVGGGMVFIGNTNAERGTERGYVGAYDAATGRRLWRFYTVPGNPADGFDDPAMEKASKTWGPNYWKNSGASSPWEGMTYDEKLQTLYVGVGNASHSGEAKPGEDKLFSNSIVALDAKTGKVKWYYQEVPGGDSCCDGTAHIQLVDLPMQDGVRRVVMQAAKDGFFYVIDARTGQLISGTNYILNNWASRIDPTTGRIVLDDRTADGGTGKILQPAGMGARAWELMAYNPQSHLVYIPAFIWPEYVKLSKKDKDGSWDNFGDAYYGSYPDAKIKALGKLIAWDPVARRERWHVDHMLPLNGGVLATAGNLLFQGTADGTFNAYAADTGEQLWKFDAHGLILAGAATVQVNGEQWIIVPSGDGGSTISAQVMPRMTGTPNSRGPSRLLAFKLGGQAIVSRVPPPMIPRPFRPVQPAALAARGAQLYTDSGCYACHGLNAEKAGASIPDLRRSSEETYNAMEAILVEGAYRPAGMPSFPKLTPEDIKAIQAFMTNAAWDGYNRQEIARKP